MTTEFVSVRTRNAVRDVLKAKPLQALNDLFEECCGVRPGIPTLLLEGHEARQELIERRLSSLNLGLREDANKLLRIVERIAEECPDLSQGTTALDKLQQALLSDGFAIEPRKLSAKSMEKQILFPGFTPSNSVSRSTREKIRDSLVQSGAVAEGKLTFRVLVSRFAAVPTGPSMTEVVESALASSKAPSSFELLALFGTKPLDWPDEPFLRLLTESLHPDVHSALEAQSLLAIYNQHLAADGWEIAKGPPVPGKTNYKARPRDSGIIVSLAPMHSADILSQEHLREVDEKCQKRLGEKDLRGAITAARTLVEEVLSEIEKLRGPKARPHKDLPTQFKVVAGLMGIGLTSNDLYPATRTLVQGLATAVQGLAEVRNELGDAHSSTRNPTFHEAQLAVNASKTIAFFLVAQHHARPRVPGVQKLDP